MTAFGLEATTTFTEGNDFYVFATIRNDVIAGLGGDDVIIGGPGVDYIDGGSGNDMAVTQITFANAAFEIDDNGFLVVSDRSGGLLSFRHTLANIERVQFLTLDERSVASLIELAGGDPPPEGQVFVGTNGPDQLFGNAGDDVFRPLFGGDVVRGGAGTDRLELPTTLSNTQVFLTTPTELAFNGNVGTQSFAYVVQDVETFQFSDGATFTFAELADLATNPVPPIADPTPGPDTIVGTDGADAFGGGRGDDVLQGAGGADTISGGAGNDRVLGGSGNDRLIGNDGNDTLVGGNGRDQLIGGKGVDVLSGGEGADTFIFNDGDTNRRSDRRDVITDFDGRDVIDLRGIDANKNVLADQAFEFAGGSPAANGLWFVASGRTTTVFGDTNGDGRADFAINLNGVISLTASDFLL